MALSRKHLYYAISIVFLLLLAGWLSFVTRQEALARFTTDLSERTSDQRHNITLAAGMLNEKVIPPGAVFSFNKTLGPCTPSRGFCEAPAIQAGEIKPGWGGGICQLSSTLYNTALLAGLPILERNPHSTPARSVPPGRDAMVAAGISDLKFRNNTGAPLQLRCRITGDRLVTTLLGRKKASSEIRLTTRFLNQVPFPVRIEADPTLPPGKHILVNPGSPGFMIEMTRDFCKEGRVTRKEIISSDLYEPSPRIIRTSTHR